MTTTAIRTIGLTQRFGDTTAVDGVDLEIGSGEVVALLGPNGAGKTTTLDILLGLALPDDGSAEVFGLTPRAAVRAGRIGAVLQSGGLLADLTVSETARIVASAVPAMRTVDGVLDTAGLTELARRPVGKCSGGEQQRLRFALALIADPDLLVLDEPTAAMDVASRRAFWAAMRADTDAGRTVVFATHHLEEADEYADRVVVMARGRIVADGPTEQIRSRVTGRTVSVTFRESDPDLDRDTLASLPGVHSVEVRGRRVLLHSHDSDALARRLLDSTTAYDIEITSAALEDAFVSLTEEVVR
ncbi:ABC transporter ATP-binding protein [Rhodococcus rhodnii]|uniref:ABC transporter n=2 Tax=Rhodococcus rhodnii TaxID=38312 RepID=R7WRK3_9NOCA|nr:ABC transporter ATP-binding protein [Rhodococcus rhodnii]EOM76604.1 ABC transporter [Rhodococcus rhodnii LMG 5362]TXG89488.1 ABC transporter ATP-binding protein [Rhodococcus rhodnii]